MQRCRSIKPNKILKTLYKVLILSWRTCPVKNFTLENLTLHSEEKTGWLKGRGPPNTQKVFTRKSFWSARTPKTKIPFPKINRTLNEKPHKNKNLKKKHKANSVHHFLSVNGQQTQDWAKDNSRSKKEQRPPSGCSWRKDGINKGTRSKGVHHPTTYLPKSRYPSHHSSHTR